MVAVALRLGFSCSSSRASRQRSCVHLHRRDGNHRPPRFADNLHHIRPGMAAMDTDPDKRICGATGTSHDDSHPASAMDTIGR